MASRWNLNAVALVLSLAVACVLGEKYNSEYRIPMGHHRCDNLSPQKFIEMDHIMGTWYGAEMIDHMVDKPSVTELDTCVIIHLEDTTDEYYQSQHQGYIHRDRDYGYGQKNYDNNNNHRYNPNRDLNKYLRVKWDEHDLTLDYELSYNDSNTGYWKSIAPQRGSMVTRNNYQQFTGSIQVLKAVGNHLVLTFCATSPEGKMTSLILSRQPNILSYEELRSIKNLLNYRHIPVNSVKKVCLNGAAASIFTSKTALLLALVSLFFVLRASKAA